MLTGQLGEAFYVFVTLIAMINPISAAAVFATFTEGRSAKDQAQIALRASIVAGITLIAFAFAGEALLGALGVEIGAFKIAGGLAALQGRLRYGLCPDGTPRDSQRSARERARRPIHRSFRSRFRSLPVPARLPPAWRW